MPSKDSIAALDLLGPSAPEQVSYVMQEINTAHKARKKAEVALPPLLERAQLAYAEDQFLVIAVEKTSSAT